MHTGATIKLFREKMGYSQETVATFLGIKREMISYFETGARSPNLTQLEKLSDLFGIDLDVFFTEDIKEVELDCSLAFRADNLRDLDLKSIMAFRKIIKNYRRITNLEKDND